jgi:hypothetical protein
VQRGWIPRGNLYTFIGHSNHRMRSIRGFNGMLKDGRSNTELFRATWSIDVPNLSRFSWMPNLQNIDGKIFIAETQFM